MSDLGLKLSYENIKKQKSNWESIGVKMPEYDPSEVAEKTKNNPGWLHFGAGNIFKGFIAVLQNNLLNQNKEETGIIIAESFDYEIIEKVYEKADNLSLTVIMEYDGNIKKEVIGSIAESLVADVNDKDSWERLKIIFAEPSLKMVSFTITEKGYQLFDINGKYLTIVESDVNNGLKNPTHVISKVVALLYNRFKNGKKPLALVSMDNCSKNGEMLFKSVEHISEKWVEKGFVEKEFLNYVKDENMVSFPWSMIDKITPRPSGLIKEKLDLLGLEEMDIVKTSKGTFISQFVNAEAPEYLVIEDKFPNGRYKLEESGVIFTSREMVEKVEKMKVCTCLNPLHTALAVFGCLLNIDTIAQEMKDENLKKLVINLGKEGMPVVINPGIIDPEKFIDEVINIRLTNEFIVDIPQRIATDTSQKVGIRFGETIKAYNKSGNLSIDNLKIIPLVIAGWLRYLMGIDDNGNDITLSSDPMMDELKSYISKITFKDKTSIGDNLDKILSNEKLFGVDLIKIGMDKKIKNYFESMIEDVGAVKNLISEVNKG